MSETRNAIRQLFIIAEENHNWMTVLHSTAAGFNRDISHMQRRALIAQLRRLGYANAGDDWISLKAAVEAAAERGEIGKKVEAEQQPTPARRGRLPKEESEAKRTAVLATIRQHPSLKDDMAALAAMVGVSESSARRWIEAEQQKFLQSRAANAPDDDEE